MGTIRDDIHASYKKKAQPTPFSNPVDLDAVLQALVERVNALQKERHKHDCDPNAVARFLPFSDDEIEMLFVWMKKSKTSYELSSLYYVEETLIAELSIEKIRRESKRKESKRQERQTEAQQATS
jgi:hypothetical protein